MPHSRYNTIATEAERCQAHQLIQSVGGQPLAIHRSVWEEFVRDVIRLPLCYLDSVHKIVEDGKWKAKYDPIAFIRKAAQSAALGSFGLAEERKDNTKIHVGRAIDPDQKRPPTLEESLRFNPPKRRPEVYAGSISDLRLPRFMEMNEKGSDWGSIHDEAVDYFTDAYGQDDFDKRPRQRDIAPDVLEPLNGELVDELESGLIDWDDPDLWVQKVDWSRLADKTGLDKGERMVLKWRLTGESRESVMARQRTPEKQRDVQAAWKRFDRKLPRIVEAIKRPPPEPPVTLPLIVPDGGHAISAPEALRSLEKRHEAEKNQRRLAPESLPSLPRYTDYARG